MTASTASDTSLTGRGAAVVAAVAESDVDLGNEMVLADVERLWPRLVHALGAGVAVAAAVGRTSVIPVRVQSSVADFAVIGPARAHLRAWPSAVGRAARIC